MTRQAQRGKCKVLQLLAKSRGSPSFQLQWRHLAACTRLRYQPGQGLNGKETKYLCEYGISCVLSLAYRYYRHTGCNCQENEQEDFVPVHFYLESESDQFKELQIFQLFSCQISGMRTNTWFLSRSTPSQKYYNLSIISSYQKYFEFLRWT